MKWFSEKILNQSGLFYYLLNAVIIGGCIGLLIIQNEPLFIFVAFFLSVRLILFSNPKTFLYVIIISVFFADWLHVLGLIPEQFTWIPDMIILFLSIKLIRIIIKEKQVIRTSSDLPIILFTAWAVLSMLISGQSVIAMFVSLRQLLKFTVLFYIILYLQFGEKFYKNLIRFLVILFAVQVPTALVKMVIYGQGEHAIGTYAYFGGGLTAVLPVIVMSFALGFYFYRRTSLWYLVFILYFQLFYIACPKRMYPFFACIVFLYLLKISGIHKIKKILPYAPILVLVLGLLLYTSPELKTFFNNPKNLLNWSTSYTYQKTDGQTSGRVAVAELIFDTLKKKPVRLAFGFGPGSVTESFDTVQGSLRDELSIYYGWTEFSMMALEYGYVGVILFLWILFSIFRKNFVFFKNTQDPYWKAISFGHNGLCVLYFLAFFYTTIFRLDVSALLFWLFSAFIFSVRLDRDRVSDAK